MLQSQIQRIFRGCKTRARLQKETRIILHAIELTNMWAAKGKERREWMLEKTALNEENVKNHDVLTISETMIRSLLESKTGAKIMLFSNVTELTYRIATPENASIRKKKTIEHCTLKNWRHHRHHAWRTETSNNKILLKRSQGGPKINSKDIYLHRVIWQTCIQSMKKLNRCTHAYRRIVYIYCTSQRWMKKS